MGNIKESVEKRIQEELRRSTRIVLGECELYLNLHFFRYVEGNKHITGDASREFAGSADNWYWLPWIFRELFARRKLVLRIDAPVSWDNDRDALPESELQRVLSQIELAVKKRHRRYELQLVPSNGVK
jgi:hypothetical protein